MNKTASKFSEQERQAVYRAIFERRDVRSNFLPTPISDKVIVNVLSAAHQAPSVGFMQPWDFIVISSPEIKVSVKAIFELENEKAAKNYSGEQAELYKSLKLEGILESPINICVTCNRKRGGSNVLGRNTIFDTDVFSVCLAVQNLWLAARAEGLGIGWVSIVDQNQLKSILKLPEDVYPIAYLCMGYVDEFNEQPDLEKAGWRSRVDLGSLLHANTWGTPLKTQSVLPNVSKSNKTSKKSKPALMFQGTASSVGKSLMTAAFCRILKEDGFRVAPFKAQNMSNNSWVTFDGKEMARSQVVQAQAAKIEPDSRMNPILLKPLSDKKSQIVLHGEPVGNYDFCSYGAKHDQYFEEVCRSYNSLSSEFDVMVLEGAGSSAEVNLKSKDLVNMKMARHADASVIIVGDIDRGGVFASFVGMMSIFDNWEKKLVKGFLVNRFRGDESLLVDALDYIDDTLGVPILGVVPMLKDLILPEEDGVQFSENTLDDKIPLGDRIDIALIGLGRVSNYNDVDPLRFESDVRLRIVRSVEDLRNPDVVIIPGSRNVFEDLYELKNSGLDLKIRELALSGKAEIVGLCGGLQMLGNKIYDPNKIESSGETMVGLELLNLSSELQREKCLTRETALHHDSSFEVHGYRIHHGQTIENNSKPAITSKDGQIIGYQDSPLPIWGTYLHGIFDDDTFRRWFIDKHRVRKGLSALEEPTFAYSLEADFDRLADQVRSSINMNHIYELLNLK